MENDCHVKGNCNILNKETWDNDEDRRVLNENQHTSGRTIDQYAVCRAIA
jgi:hypothetical protein